VLEPPRERERERERERGFYRKEGLIHRLSIEGEGLIHTHGRAQVLEPPIQREGGFNRS
jgi:hypothetical protein